MDPQETKLVQGLRAGEQWAVRELVTRHRGLVWRVAGRILRSSDSTDEVVQDTFIRVVGKIDQFDQGRGVRFTTWLGQIAKNRALDHLRSVRRREHCYGTLAEGLATLAADSVSGAMVTGGIECREILDAVEALPPRRREVMRLHLEGFTYTEISAQVGIKQRTVGTTLDKARASLRSRLGLSLSRRGAPKGSGAIAAALVFFTAFSLLNPNA